MNRQQVCVCLGIGSQTWPYLRKLTVLLLVVILQDTVIATRTAAFPTFTANWLGRWSYIYQVCWHSDCTGDSASTVL
jgi:hypothetical protein